MFYTMVCLATAQAPWYEVGQGIIHLLVGLVGLLSGLVGAYFAIKNWVASLKGKKANEIWGMIIEMANAAMKTAEASDKKGVDKKTMVIELVKSSCQAAGVDVSAFLDPLNIYIDQMIAFVNDMKQQGKK